ncbi:MAG: FtsX-like permease family protein [Acidimicrobiales bacterium]|nr:FtsX-like permease family protein [Acidimicrobiales bacterium]
MTRGSVVWRWAARTLLREWRQYVGALAMITLGVALAVGGAVAAFNLVEPAEREVGRAQFIATSSDPAALMSALDDQGIEYATRSSVDLAATGTTRRVEVRAFDPEGDVLAPLVDLADGRWPVSANEIAVTDRAMADVGVGGSLSLAGTTFDIVGRIENPTDLDDEFALAAASLDLEDLGEEPIVEVFVAASPESVDLSAVGDAGIADFGPPPAVVAAIAVEVAAAVGLLEVALIVSTSFAVAASRRSREYGVLAAVGASPGVVRSAARSVGLGVGVLGALVGALIGLVAAWAMVPGFESSVHHRIDFAVPWWTVVPSAVVAVVVTAVAADSPARAVSRRPVVELLGAARPRQEGVGARGVVGGVVGATGVVALWVGFSRHSDLLSVVGALLAPVGFVLMAPLLVSAIGRTSGHLPLAPRFAGRSLARSPKRSGAVVAALGLVLAVPFGIAVVTSSLDERDARRGSNLAENWVIAWVPVQPPEGFAVPSESVTADAAVRRDALESEFPELDFIPIDVAVRQEPIGSTAAVAPLVSATIDPTLCSLCDIDVYGFGDRDAAGREIEYLVDSAWLATPELIAALGVDTEWGGATVASSAPGYGLADLTGVLVPEEAVHVSATWPRHATIPQVLYDAEAAVGGPYEIVRVGWLGVAEGAIDEAVQARLVAAVGPDLLLEFHDPLAPASGLRTAGLLAGLVAAAGIAFAAMTMLLAELGSDLRLLVAVGARPVTSRRIAAGAGAMLALAGALVGVAIGFVPMLPLLAAGGGEYRAVVPWSALAALVLGFPLLTAALGLAARQHRTAPARWENGHDARSPR